MAILEKEVWVGVTSYQKYYEKLGYEIPREKDNRGRLRAIPGTKILIKTKDLMKNSDVKITKICDDCGEFIKNQHYRIVIKHRKHGDGKDRCQNCALLNNWIKRKANISYERTLEYYAIENNKLNLLDEFSIKNKLKPCEIYKSSKEIYIWNCPKCKSEYKMNANKRTNSGHGCTFCSGHEVNNTNCLATTHPEVAIMLKNQELGFKITKGSSKVAEFICPNCGNIEAKKVQNVVYSGFSCTNCSDGISYPEKIMFNLLNQLNVNFKKEKTFEWLSKKRYDFYIPSLNIIIETHGNQHYEETSRGRTLVYEIKNDILKKDMALNNGIKEYIVIDCRKSDLNYIKENITKSKLNDIFDLSNVNWLTCHEFACSSLVKTTCEMWENGLKNTVKIGEILRLDRSNVSKYLKKGALLGWCDYDPKEVQKLNGVFAGKGNKRKVIQMTLENNFLKEWGSISDAANYLNIYSNNISKVCKNKCNSSGGFKWMYKEDYDKYIKQAQ